jgi:Zn finger protein HypA/HybF involved in hydrogenase expression
MNIKGRNIVQPYASTRPEKDGIVIRIDDAKIQETWLEIFISNAELKMMLATQTSGAAPEINTVDGFIEMVSDTMVCIECGWEIDRTELVNRYEAGIGHCPRCLSKASEFKQKGS